jgi:VWFA-related protein
MTRLVTLAALAVLVPAWSPAAETNAPPVFSSGVDLITVDAVVVDEDGRPVPGLTRDDFIVKEDGKDQRIATFEAFVLDPPAAAESVPAAVLPASNEVERKTSGRSYAVVVDDLSVSMGEALSARKGLAGFIDKGLRDGDEITLATTSGDVWWSTRIPEGRADLQAVVGRIRGRASDPLFAADYISAYEAYQIAVVEDHNIGRVGSRVIDRFYRTGACIEGTMGARNPECPPRVQGQARARHAARMQQVRATLTMLRRATEALAPVRGRKALLFVSRGFVGDTQLPLREVTAASREANVAVYFIDARGLSGTQGLPSAQESGGAPDPGQVGAMAFESGVLDSAGTQDLASDTGGFTIRNTNDLAQGAERVAQQSRVFYLLGFYPPEGKKPGDWRKLKVEVRRKGLEVHARRGYTVRKAAPPEKNEKAVSPLVVRALDSAHDAAGLPLRAMAYVLEPRAKGNTRVLVAAEIDARQLSFSGPDDARVARVEVSVMTTHRDTAEALQATQRVEVKLLAGQAAGWRGLVQEFDLSPGVGQVRVVARDMATNTLGAVSHRFVVPPPVGLRVSTPIVSDQLADTGDPKKPVPALAVHRVFRPEGLLYCQLEVFGAARDAQEARPRVAMGLEVRTPAGHLVRQGAPTRVTPDANGRLVRLLGVGLDGVGEGTYDLILTVKDEVSGDSLERRETFQLARADVASPAR